MKNREISVSEVVIFTNRFRRLLQQRISDALKEEDLSVTQWLILGQLRLKNESTITEISADVDHSQGALSRAVFYLKNKGLISSKIASADRRIIVLSLSVEGEILTEKLDSLINPKVMSDLSKSIGSEGVSRMMSLIWRAGGALR